MKAGGGDVRRISGALSGISWSPDGERLALVRVVGEDAALVTMAPNGSDLEVITWLTDVDVLGENGREAAPLIPRIDPISWSPDGSRILFRCGDRLCVVTLDGQRVEAWPLDSVDEGGQFQAAWSPDGSRIAVYGEFDWRLREPDRRTERQISVGGWSRSDDRAYRIVLFTMAPDGSDVRFLLGRNGDGDLDLVGVSGPDGTRDVRVCAAGRVVADPDAHPELVRDCETLLGLRDALTGSAELDWFGGRDLSAWRGVAVGGRPPRVRELHLAGNAIYGQIPPEIGDLSGLTRLGLAYTGLRGSIPAELGRLSNLTSLDLPGSRLTGEIPAELGGLTNLIRLNLSNNRLEGAIPAELSQLANLEELYLRGNQLSGCIPAALQRVPKNDLGSLGLPNCEPR